MKYELTNETRDVHGQLLYRIRRLQNGESGGFVRSESSLSQSGTCWAHGDSVIMDNASVSEDAQIYGVVQDNGRVRGSAIVHGVVHQNALVCDHAKIFGRIGGDREVGDHEVIYGDES